MSLTYRLGHVAWKVDFQAYAAYQGLSEEDRALDSEGGMPPICWSRNVTVTKVGQGMSRYFTLP